MSRSQRIVFGFLSIGVLIMCVLVVQAALDLGRTWQTPLGPELGLPTATPYDPFPTLLPTWTAFAPVTPLPPGHPPTGTPSPTFTPTPAALCGGPPVMTILSIGTDSRSDSYLYGLGDVIRLVRVDFTAPNVMIMSFPRDLYVEIPDIAEHYDITHGKLNQAYLYGNPGFGYYDGPGAGPGLLARTMSLNFGVHPDQYIAVNMRTFTKIVDAVGGIDVTLPHTIDGRAADQPNRDDLVFKAGRHHLNGKQALQLARLRPDGVFERAKAQNHVLCGLRDKLVSPSVVADIPDIIAAFQGSVQTDLSPAQISQLSCLGTHLDGKDIIFLNWPEEMFKGTRVNDPILGRTFVWDVDFDLIRDYVQAFTRGQWPAPPQPASTASPSSGSPSFCE